MTARPLTQNEIALAQKIFGHALDYKRIKIHRKSLLPFLPQNTAMAPNHHIYMPGRLYCPDYALSPPHLQALFIHEMAHVWQHQNKVLHVFGSFLKETVKHKFNYAAAYDYTLKQNRDLTHYGLEQQARIIEDYFLLTEFAYNRCGFALCDYEAVLKNFLANPAYCKRKSYFKSSPLRKKK
jgi:hypothetical protein